MAVGNSINEQTTGICGFTGTAFTGTAVVNYNLIIGGSTSSTLTNVAPSATSGIPVISQGASSNPTFGTAVVAGGGTGQVTLTNRGVLIGQGTSAIAQTATGSSGQILRSGGASADPAYSTATYPSTAGTSGNVLTSDGTNWNSTAPAASTGYQIYNYVNNTAYATNPGDSTTLYFFQIGAAAWAAATTNTKIFIPRTGTITSATVNFFNIGVNGTSETSTVSIRLNDTSDTTISSAVTNNNQSTAVSNLALSIAVTAGDFINIKWVTPAWATNPTQVVGSILITVS